MAANDFMKPTRQSTPAKRQIKARRMYLTVFSSGQVGHILCKKRSQAMNAGPLTGYIPVAILDVSDPEALIEQAAEAITKVRFTDSKLADFYPDCVMRREAHAVIQSLGLLLPERRKGRAK